MKFTIHALHRLEDRTSLSEQEALELIENGLCCDLFAEKGTNRTHTLIYSDADGDFFEFVVDYYESEIVTVLPCNYKRVSEVHMEEARSLALGCDAVAIAIESTRIGKRIESMII